MVDEEFTLGANRIQAGLVGLWVVHVPGQSFGSIAKMQTEAFCSIKYQKGAIRKGTSRVGRGPAPSGIRATKLEPRTPANVGVVVRHSKTWWSTAAMGQRRSSGDVRDRSAHTPIATQKRTFAHFANVPLAEVSTACFAASLPSCPGGGCASRGCCSAGKAS